MISVCVRARERERESESDDTQDKMHIIFHKMEPKAHYKAPPLICCRSTSLILFISLWHLICLLHIICKQNKMYVRPRACQTPKTDLIHVPANIKAEATGKIADIITPHMPLLNRRFLSPRVYQIPSRLAAQNCRCYHYY